MNTYSDKDILFMQRALQLAQNAMGTASPNPMVGCVIVYNDEVIGEGWTQPYGGAHAEVQAIDIVHNKGILSDSTAYVTLEPCAHFGKTPPCADLLAKYKLKRVVVACTDPNPLVSGKGIERLKESGIEVNIGLMESEALESNKRFFTTINKKRPYIILKWAETKDGFVARSNYDSKWISNQYSRKLVHKWRAEEDSIMVGTNTAKYDDPMLNVREWQGNDPVRIVIDKQLSLDKNLKLFHGKQPTLCYNLIESKSEGNTTFVSLDKESFIEALIADLHARKIQSVIVEGGGYLLQSLIDKNLWDEARIFKANSMFEEGIAAPKIDGFLISEEDILGDKLRIIKNEKS